ncbi:MAG: MFS transporter [Candidatus Paceibacterota bacterium]
MRLNTVQKFIWISLFSQFGRALTAVTFTLFFISKGLNLFQVNILAAIIFAMILFFELPTGLFADRFSRKMSFVIACALQGIGLFGYAAANSFEWCLVAALVDALGVAFANGAFHAWLYDQLAHEGDQKLQRIAYAREGQMFYIAMIAGSLIGPYLAMIDSRFPWLLGGGILLLLSIVSNIVMHETYAMPEIKKEVVFYFLKSHKDPVLRYIFLLGCLQVFATVAPDYQWQPYFQGLGLDTIQLGYLLAACFVAGFIGSKIAEKFRREDLSGQTLFGLQVVLGFGIILSVAIPMAAFAILMLLIQEISRGMFSPIQRLFLQRNIMKSEQRATIASMASMAGHFGAIFGLFVSGAAAHMFNIQIAWTVSGLIVIGGSLVVFLNFRKANIRKA